MSVSIRSSPSHQRRHTALNECQIAIEEASDPAVYTSYFETRVFAKQLFYHTLFPFSLPFLLCWDGIWLARNMGFLSWRLGSIVGNWLINLHLFGVLGLYIHLWSRKVDIGVSGIEVTVAAVLLMVQRVMIAIKYAYMLPIDYQRMLSGEVSREVMGEEQLLTGWAHVTPTVALKNLERTVIRMGSHVGMLSVEFKAKDMPFVRSALAPTRRAAMRELRRLLDAHAAGGNDAACFHNGHEVLDALLPGAKSPATGAAEDKRAAEEKGAAADASGPARGGDPGEVCQVGEHAWAKGYSILRDVSRWGEGQLGASYRNRGPTSNSVSIVLIALHLLLLGRGEGEVDVWMRTLHLEARLVFPLFQVVMLFALRWWAGEPLLGFGWWGPVLTVNVALILLLWTSVTMQFMNIGILDYRRRVVNMRNVGAFLEHSMSTAALQQLQLARRAEDGAASRAAAASRYGSFRGLLRTGRAVARDVDSDLSRLPPSPARPPAPAAHDAAAVDSAVASGLTALAHRMGFGTPRVLSSRSELAGGGGGMDAGGGDGKWGSGGTPDKPARAAASSALASGSTVAPPSPVRSRDSDLHDPGSPPLAPAPAPAPGPRRAGLCARLACAGCDAFRRRRHLRRAAAVRPAEEPHRQSKAWRSGAARSQRLDSGADEGGPVGRKGGGGGARGVETDPELTRLMQSVGAGRWNARMLPHMRLDSAHNFTAWLALRRAMNEYGIRYWRRVQMYTSLIATLLLMLVGWFVYATVFWGDDSKTLEVFTAVNVLVFCVIWLQMVGHGHRANAQTGVHTARLREVQIGLRDTLAGGCGLRETQFVVPEEVVKVVAVRSPDRAAHTHASYSAASTGSDPTTQDSRRIATNSTSSSSASLPTTPAPGPGPGTFAAAAAAAAAAPDTDTAPDRGSQGPVDASPPSRRFAPSTAADSSQPNPRTPATAAAAAAEGTALEAIAEEAPGSGVSRSTADLRSDTRLSLVPGPPATGGRTRLDPLPRKPDLPPAPADPPASLTTTGDSVADRHVPAESVDSASDGDEKKDGESPSEHGPQRRLHARQQSEARSLSESAVEADDRRGLIRLRDATQEEKKQVGIKALVPTIFHIESSGAMFAVTPSAERRLMEADSVAAAVMRSLWADDRQRPVKVLGMRASTTIVRSVVLVLLSGATFFLRASSA